MTQTQRLLAYLETHPGASSLEITLDLAIVNVTGRVSDARVIGRSLGFDVECKRRPDGRDGYWIRYGPQQLTWDVAS